MTLHLPRGDDEPFIKNLTEYWPGGEHVIPHLNDGPYYATVLRVVDQPNWMAASALAAYPGVEVPLVEIGLVLDATLVVVPEFVHRLLEWYETEDELILDAGVTVFEQAPDDGDLAEHLAGMLVPDSVAQGVFEHLTDVLRRALTRMGLASVAALLRGLDDSDSLTDSDPIADVLDAALSDPQLTPA